MKRLLSLLLCTVMIFGVVAMSGCSAKKDDKVLRIFSWEDYISVDEETDTTMADDFAEWYYETYGERITVEYSTFGTNEIMYNELKINGGSCDLMCPSDYMIQKMINEDMLEEFSPQFLDPNNEGSYYAKYVSEYITDLFDAHAVGDGKTWNNYAAGYMWGTMGFVYNPQKVDEQDMQSWGALWNGKYHNRSTLKDSVRDTYLMGLAYVYRDELNALDRSDKQYNEKLNEILNRTDDATLQKVEAALKEVKKNIFGFEVDTGRSDMVTGKIDINVAWSGDAVSAMDEAEDPDSVNPLELYYKMPDEGSNIWFDGWVMPKGANKKLAEAFVNYVSMPENACLNMDYIGYTSAIAGDVVFDRMVDLYELETLPEDGYSAADLTYFFTDLSGDRQGVVYTPVVGRQFNAQYPTKTDVDRCAVMMAFDPETNDKVNAIWENIKGADFPYWVVILIGALIVIALATYLFRKYGNLRPSVGKKGYKIISRG